MQLDTGRWTIWRRVNPVRQRRRSCPQTGQPGQNQTGRQRRGEAAANLEAGKRTGGYRLSQKGEIPAFTHGGTWRFRRAEGDSWIARSIKQEEAGGRVTVRQVCNRITSDQVHREDRR